MRVLMYRQIVSFGVVGVVGYVVDTTVLYALLYVGLGPYVGRIFSYLAAVTCTWQLNRRYTFRSAARTGAFAEWRRFALSQLSGAAVNLGVYAALIHGSNFTAQHPAVGVAAGSLMGMLANYVAASRYAFAGERVHRALE